MRVWVLNKHLCVCVCSMRQRSALSLSTCRMWSRRRDSWRTVMMLWVKSSTHCRTQVTHTQIYLCTSCKPHSTPKTNHHTNHWLIHTMHTRAVHLCCCCVFRESCSRWRRKGRQRGWWEGEWTSAGVLNIKPSQHFSFSLTHDTSVIHMIIRRADGHEMFLSDVTCCVSVEDVRSSCRSRGVPSVSAESPARWDQREAATHRWAHRVSLLYQSIIMIKHLKQNVMSYPERVWWCHILLSSKNQALELELAHVRSSLTNLKIQDESKSACLEQLSYVTRIHILICVWCCVRVMCQTCFIFRFQQERHAQSKQDLKGLEETVVSLTSSLQYSWHLWWLRHHSDVFLKYSTCRRI